MSLRSSLNRLAIAAAAGALVTAAAVTPAAADDGWGDDDPGVSRQDGGGNQHGDSNQQSDQHGDSNQQSNQHSDPNQQSNQHSDQHGDSDHHGDHHDNPRLSRGVITARGGLALRSAPNRGSRIIRVAAQGEEVSIFCKTPGEPVRGNPLWYLLTDGTWAWGAARYIDNIGPAPRWC
jgi:hypothetical protein